MTDKREQTKEIFANGVTEGAYICTFNLNELRRAGYAQEADEVESLVRGDHSKYLPGDVFKLRYESLVEEYLTKWRDYETVSRLSGALSNMLPAWSDVYSDDVYYFDINSDDGKPLTFGDVAKSFKLLKEADTRPKRSRLIEWLDGQDEFTVDIIDDAERELPYELASLLGEYVKDWYITADKLGDELDSYLDGDDLDEDDRATYTDIAEMVEKYGSRAMYESSIMLSPASARPMTVADLVDFMQYMHKSQPDYEARYYDYRIKLDE